MAQKTDSVRPDEFWALPEILRSELTLRALDEIGACAKERSSREILNEILAENQEITDLRKVHADAPVLTLDMLNAGLDILDVFDSEVDCPITASIKVWRAMELARKSIVANDD
jgi:hypothetical protein